MKTAAIIVWISIVLSLGTGPASGSAPDASAVTIAGSTARISGGDADQRASVVRGLERFSEHGLHLPALAIYIHDGREGCSGFAGYWRAAPSVDRIDVCTDRFGTILHELAHAWDNANLTDSQREAFLAQTDAESWSDADTRWSRRGDEMLANTIAWGLADAPLERGERERTSDELELFREFSGRPSPRLTTSK